MLVLHYIHNKINIFMKIVDMIEKIFKCVPLRME